MTEIRPEIIAIALLDRRAGKATNTRCFQSLSSKQRKDFVHTSGASSSFEALPDWAKKLILDCEVEIAARLIPTVAAGGEFDEGEHPRDEKGMFTSKGEGVAQGTSNKEDAISKIKGIERLEKEAKTYKTPEEFISSQGMPFIHETDAKFTKFDPSKIGTGQGEAWLGRGIYLQEKGAFKFETYGSHKVEAYLASDAKIFRDENDGGLLKYAEQKDILTPQMKDKLATYTEATLPKEYFISEDKIGDRSTYLVMGKNTMPDGSVYWSGITYVPQDTKESALKAAYNELNDIHELGNITPKDLFDHTDIEAQLKKDGYDGVYNGGELVIYNTDVIKTREELAEVWLKAKSSPEPIDTEVSPRMVNEDAFLNYHNTGYIDPESYHYNTVKDLAWLKPEAAPLRVKTLDTGKGKIELRKRDEKLQYVKHDDEGEIVRDNRGLAVYLNDAEIELKGFPKKDTSVIAFNDKNEAVGLASNEFGADGVWVVNEYQKQGIGVSLLIELRSQFKPDRKIGQMTPAGEAMTRSYFRALKRQGAAYSGASGTFDESKHPRDEKGMFTESGTGVTKGTEETSDNHTTSPVDEKHSLVTKMRQIDDEYSPKITESWLKARQFQDGLNPIYEEYGVVLSKLYEEKNPVNVAELKQKEAHFDKLLAVEGAKHAQICKETDALRESMRLKAIETLYLRDESELDLDVHTNMYLPGNDREVQETKLSEANDFVGRITEEKYISQVKSVGVEIIKNLDRAYAEQKTIFVSNTDSKAVIVHEIGHVIEENNPEVLKKAQEFYEWRTQGQSLEKLSVVTGNKKYRDDEVTKKDDFKNSYCGKQYKSGKNTELVSMGMELLYTNPVSFAKTDAEYFTWIVDVLRRK